MKKKITLALTGAVAVGLAAPALAETTFSGFLFISPMIATDKATTGTKNFQADGASQKPVDQRMRFTMTNKINDFASVVWQTEIDTPWGDVDTVKGHIDGSKTSGGQLNTDGINLETKHLYLTAKIPDSDFGLVLGQQAVADKIGKLYLGNDASAAIVTYAKDALGVNFGFAKPTGDDEIWVLQAAYKVSDTIGVNAELYNYDYDTPITVSGRLYKDYMTAGVGVNAAVSGINLDAALALQSGDKASGLLANIGAKMAIDKINAGARLVYIADDDKKEGWISLTETPLAGEGLYFMAFSGGANKLTGKYAITDAAMSGYGLLGLIVNGSTAVDAYTIKGALGFFQALSDDITPSVANDSKDGKILGTELAVTVSRKLAEKIDVSLFASYVMLGDFYGKTGVNESGNLYVPAQDTDNPYAIGLRINAPF